MSFDAALGELLSVCRRAGMPVSPVEAIDVRRAALAAGVERRDDLRAALRAVVVKDAAHVAAFDRAFDAFFRAGASGSAGVSGELGAAPLDARELAALLAAIEASRRASARSPSPSEGAGDDPLAAVALGGDALDRALGGAASGAGTASMRSAMQGGYFTQRTLDALGVDAMRERLPELRAALAAELGEDRADEVVAALERALDGLRRAARSIVDAEHARRSANDRELFRRRALAEARFADLRPEEIREIEREVRRLAERLRGRLSVRRRRRRRGKLDVRRTIRAAQRTGGVPFRPVFRRRREDRPKLVVLCDISDSVRFSVRFLLLLTWALQDVFARTRTFAFVSDLGETTQLFREHPIERAIELVYAGVAVSVASGSDYGRALGVFASRHLDAVDGKTTVVVVGDGRTNYLDPNDAALARIGARAARLLWLDPEPRASWGFGDSAMNEYLPHVDEAHPVQSLETLRIAVDRLLSPRS